MSMDLTVQIRLSRLRRVQLETLPDTFSQDVESWIGLHDLGHYLLDQWLQAREPVTICRPQVVREIHADHDTSRGGVDTHRVRNLCRTLQRLRNDDTPEVRTYVVQELRSSVPFDVVGIEVAPT